MNKLVNTLTLVLILSGGMAGQFSVLGLADEDAPYSGDVSNGGRFVAASYNSVPILWDGVARCTAVLTSGNFVKAICLGSSDFLLVREDNGQSLIEHWRTIAGQLSVVSSVTRGFEAMDLAYDPINGILYWADRARAVIEFAVWSPSVPLATSPWTLLLDSGSAPGHVLGHLPVRFQWLPPTSGSLPPVLFLGEPSWLTHWGIMLNGAPFQLQPVAVDLAAQTRSLFPSGRPHLDPLSISEGKLDARVWGAPGQAVEVVRDLTGVVIGSGAVSLGSTEVTIALTEAPVIGEIYYARLQGSADVPGASPCLKRYSNLGVSASGLSFRPLIWPSGLAIGNSGF
ncbi:MAG TPA: hypothetical protein PKA37_09905, partial [Planctomycetota bacterium]|nr:hypothetical protein [Planctomycetota bacterium]